VVLELERRLRVSEPIIKFITVRIDEEEKRLAKVKALRGTRRKLSAEPAASSHAPSVSAPSSPAPAAAAAPPVSAAPVEPAEAVQASA
jgi:small subunit ribosomal protein S6